MQNSHMVIQVIRRCCVPDRRITHWIHSSNTKALIFVVPHLSFSSLVAQVPRRISKNCALTDAAQSDYLMGFDDQSMREQNVLDPPVSDTMRNTNIGRKKSRRYRTVDLLDTKREIVDLQISFRS